jgi:hypothetical protein
MAAQLIPWGVGLAVCLTAVPVLAQHPHGGPPGLSKPGAQGHGPSNNGRPTGGTSGGEIPGGVASRVRSLGAWLDDATVMAPREAWLTLSMHQWNAPIASGLDAPVADVAGGIGLHTQLFLSLPYSRVTYTDTPAASEVGTTYFGAKIGLRDPQSGSLGVSVTPTVEILSESATLGTGFSRVNFVLPASLEWRRASTRIYGSGGYFTRGAVFVGGALEQSFAHGWVVTGALTQAWSTDHQALSEELGLASNRTDASGSVAWVTSHLMLFGSAARTLSTLDADATRYSFAAGVSLNLSIPGRRTPIAKP